MQDVTLWCPVDGVKKDAGVDRQVFRTKTLNAMYCVAKDAGRRLTRDHKPDLAEEKARVESAGGRVDFQRRVASVDCLLARASKI